MNNTKKDEEGECTKHLIRSTRTLVVYILLNVLVMMRSLMLQAN